jgi:hypothetical protein
VVERRAGGGVPCRPLDVGPAQRLLRAAGAADLPHANGCLTCPVFITTPAFLGQHRQHREQTRRLLTSATASGQLRLAEMNQQVLTDLDRIITALEPDDDPQLQQAKEAADAG